MNLAKPKAAPKTEPETITRPELEILAVLCERAERARSTVRLAPSTVRRMMRTIEKGGIRG